VDAVPRCHPRGDAAERLPAWVVRRWQGWGAGAVATVVGVGAGLHGWWTIPLALAIAGTIVGYHFFHFRAVARAAATPPPSDPPPPLATPDSDPPEDDIVPVRPATR
jgi:hypothetical protein